MAGTHTAWKIFAGVAGLYYAGMTLPLGLQYLRHIEMKEKDGLGFWERAEQRHDEHLKADVDKYKRMYEDMCKRELEREKLRQTIELGFGRQSEKTAVNQQEQDR